MEQKVAGLTLLFKFPDNRRVYWIFDPLTTVAELYEFVLVNLDEGYSFKLSVSAIPRRDLLDQHINIIEAGLEDRELILVLKQ